MSKTMPDSVLNAIREMLKSESVPFREVHHEPTSTSEESAAARGEELSTGGKALLMKAADEFRLFVLPADLRADSGSIRKRLGTKKMRFATREELLELTGLVPGSVPPFGKPILPFGLYVDSRIRDNERIAFNAGSLTDSIIMSAADYLRLAQPVDVFEFGKRATT
ncbi:MAG: YbaK/EbsC family protein [Planctomycetaceae bacterium]